MMNAVLICFGVYLLGKLLNHLAKKAEYKNTEYYKQTHIKYGTVYDNAGSLGEFEIWNYLQNVKGYKRFILNCYVPRDDGATTEVDVIMIHETGIHVFESKNYSGWIFGTETQQYWMQTLSNGYKVTEKTRFFNPILQNKVHIKWLSRFLKVDPSKFFSYIVFSEHCELKSITLFSDNHFVVKRNNLLKAVQDVLKHHDAVLTNEQIDAYYNQLYARTQVDTKTKKHHIEAIQHRAEERRSMLICPRCGGTLIFRQAKKGSNIGKAFYGCSNYPKCRYIRDIEQ